MTTPNDNDRFVSLVAEHTGIWNKAHPLGPRASKTKRSSGMRFREPFVLRKKHRRKASG